MAHSSAFDAIILKTYDVGEADRLCVLLTRERGRLLARASGARRPKSHLGGRLLPFRRIDVQLKEGRAGWIVASASAPASNLTHNSLDAFSALEEGIELLLRLVTDEGVVPEVFDATLDFLRACSEHPEHAALAYSFCLFHALGLLPGEDEMADVIAFGDAEREFLHACREGRSSTPDILCDTHRLFTLRTHLLRGQLVSPLKAEAVIASMA